MSAVAYILIFTFFGSIAALIGGFLLLFSEKLALKAAHFLASFAAGTLLASALLDLLPEAAGEAEGSKTNVYFWTLIGILIFFLLGRFLHWFHHHIHKEQEDGRSHPRATIPLIVISDTLHNFLDGVAIAATFFVSIPLGIVTAIAVFAHEVPQEIGDFGLLLHRGLSRRKVIVVNVISALFAFLGAIIAILLGSSMQQFLPIALSLTAGFFIYIALSDIIPGIHHEHQRSHIFKDTLMLLLGVLVVGFSIAFLEIK